MHGTVTLIVGLLWIGVSIAALFGILDAVRHTAAEWAAIGQSKIVWIVLLVVGLFGGPLGILSIYYWLSVSPKLKVAGRGTATS